MSSIRFVAADATIDELLAKGYHLLVDARLEHVPGEDDSIVPARAAIYNDQIMGLGSLLSSIAAEATMLFRANATPIYATIAKLNATAVMIHNRNTAPLYEILSDFAKKDHHGVAQCRDHLDLKLRVCSFGGWGNRDIMIHHAIKTLARPLKAAILTNLSE